jgi:hypothetical protein
VVWSGCNSGKYEKAECYKHEDCGACKRCVNGVCKATIDNETNCEEIAPADLSYANKLFIRFPPNVQIASLKPTWTGGKPTNYSVDHALPTGLQIDPLTGEISGTPTKMQSPTNYTITASNSAGSTSTVIIMAILDCEHWGISQCFPVPPTGQTDCYNTSSQSIISCDSIGGSNLPACLADLSAIDFCGQDAQYPDRARSFTCYNANGEIQRPCANNSSDNEVVTDSLTGLMWQRTFVSGKNWQDADDYCKSLKDSNGLNYGGYSDWRLPNPFELRSLVENHGASNPRIDTTVFPGTPPSEFWSSSSNISHTTAWYVGFQIGFIQRITSTNPYSVRCVRGGPMLTEEGAGTRFVTSEDSDPVVTDLITGLMWQKNYNTKPCSTCETPPYNWQSALKYCESLDYGGYQDWRLPNINELISLFNYKKSDPVTDFPDMQSSDFWSSSSNVYYNQNAWSVYFSSGDIDDDNKIKTKYSVCCVRLGP